MACILFFGAVSLVGVAFLGTFIGELLSNEPGMQDFPFNFGLIYVVVGSIGAIISLAAGIMNLVTAKRFSQQRGYAFIFITSILNCFSGLMGIALAIFTLIEIHKPGSKEILKGEPNSAA